MSTVAQAGAANTSVTAPDDLDPLVYARAVELGYDAGHQVGYQEGLAAADAHADTLHKAASRVATWVARDLRRRSAA